MTQTQPGAWRRVQIVNQMGLHARSAAGLARIASKASGSIWLDKDGQRADARDIMDMLTLVCGPGTEVTLLADDPADTWVLEEMATYIKDGFGETNDVF